MAFVVLQINGFILFRRSNTDNSNCFFYLSGKEYYFWCSTRFCLGSTAFLIYINDIQECSEKLQFFLFADDTNILDADNNLKSLDDIANLKLRKLCDSLTANKLTLNIKKPTSSLRHMSLWSVKSL